MLLVNQGRSIEEEAERSWENYADDGMSPIIVNQAIRLLNWMDIDGLALFNMDVKPHELVRRAWESEGEGRYEQRNRTGNGWPKETVSSEDREWWWIEDLWEYDQLRSCKSYYPQLFFGRWVPLDDFGLEESLERALEELDEARNSNEWKDWAEATDRDILIRLEN